jgi:hypothetical protein
MSDPFLKVAPGDAVDFNSVSWNAMLRAGQLASASDGVSSGPLTRNRAPAIVKVQNTTGIALDRFNVIGLGAPVWDPTLDTAHEKAFLDQIVFEGVAPTYPAGGWLYGIVIDGCAAAAPSGDLPIVRAIVSGAAIVQLSLPDQGNTSARIDVGIYDHMIACVHGSARILWMAASTNTAGYYWAVVLLGTPGSNFAIGTAAGAIPAGSSTAPGSGQATLQSGEVVNVKNACGAPAGNIAGGNTVSVAWDDGDIAWVAPLQC